MAGNLVKRPNGRWRARFRDAEGKEHARHFDRKVDARRWLDEVTTAVTMGQYVDPNAGRVTFREAAETWRLSQVHRPSTVQHVETMLRRHAYPTLGDRPLSTIRPSEVQAWVAKLSHGQSGHRALAPATVAVIHSLVASVMKAAVRDRLLASNPCEGVKLPKRESKRVVPLATDQVERIAETMPTPLRALVVLAAGTGLRQGEALGLTRDRVNFLRREVLIDRQLVGVDGLEPVFGPPKTGASNRVVPLPAVVVDALAAHVAAYDVPPGGLLFTVDDGTPITRQRFGHLWRPVARGAGLPVGVGLHALRHYYASLLIRYGESVKTVQARLGHASAAETLDTYSHLWPDSDDRTREAVDSVLGAAGVASQGGEVAALAD